MSVAGSVDIPVKRQKIQEDEVDPLEKITSDVKDWVDGFFKHFKPNEIKNYTFDQLYLNHVDVSMVELKSDLKDIVEKKSIEGWKFHSGSIRTRNVENSKFPGYLFKVCVGHPGRGNPAAHFLRVPKGKEIEEIIREENLDELEVVEESLIALKSKDEIKMTVERDQCYEFVVKSKKINLLDKKDTIARVSSYSQERQIKIAHQIMQMICRSGLGDVGFHNILMNTETGKLVVVDTEPLYGSLLLDENPNFEDQYERVNQFRKFTSNLRCINQGFDQIIEETKTAYPLFSQVAQIYKKCLA